MPFLDTTDALDRPIRLVEPPRRIVSLVPSQTELLSAVGLDAEVVGLTRFCTHPEGWKERKQIVGGTKNVDIERVRRLRPDLVIANKEENVREQIEALAKMSTVYVTDVVDVTSALAMIRDLGALTDRQSAADRLANRIAAGFAQLADEIARDSGPQPRALYLIWRDPWMTVGRDTIISDVLTRAGLANVTADRTRYPALLDAEIRQLAPDVVLLSSEPYPFADKHLSEMRELVPEAHVLLVGGEPFSWYGSRLLHTPAALHDIRLDLASGAPSS